LFAFLPRKITVRVLRVEQHGRAVIHESRIRLDVEIPEYGDVGR
jgi:hypothetical protein